MPFNLTVNDVGISVRILFLLVFQIHMFCNNWKFYHKLGNNCSFKSVTVQEKTNMNCHQFLNEAFEIKFRPLDYHCWQFRWNGFLIRWKTKINFNYMQIISKLYFNNKVLWIFCHSRFTDECIWCDKKYMILIPSDD